MAEPTDPDQFNPEREEEEEEDNDELPDDQFTDDELTTRENRDRLKRLRGDEKRGRWGNASDVSDYEETFDFSRPRKNDTRLQKVTTHKKRKFLEKFMGKK